MTTVQWLLIYTVLLYFFSFMALWTDGVQTGNWCIR